MSLLLELHTKLTSLGIAGDLQGDSITIQRSGLRPLVIKGSPDLEVAYSSYRKAKSISFNLDARELVHNNSFEVLVTRLSALASFNFEAHSLSDGLGNTVRIDECSPEFSFSFLESTEYPKFFDMRLRKRVLESGLSTRKMDSFIWRPITATYLRKGRKSIPNLRDVALSAIRASLFKVAAEQNECYAVWKARTSRAKAMLGDVAASDGLIPRAVYEEDAVSFYKVAKASPFPSQSFLAYYHVIEFFFLRVSEAKLHGKLSSLLNAPTLRMDRVSLDKVISLVRGQDQRSDETEMLRSVLDAYVQEQDIIDFVNDVEAKAGDRVYSKKRRVFGEETQINLIKDHALANAAKTIKTIRNAIAHSSDRHRREDCHIPLSDSEDVIADYVPLVRFLAEKVIYGSAQ